MKRYLTALFLFCVFFNLASGQQLFRTKRMEAVGGLGTSQFFGDIGGFSQNKNILGFKDIIFHQTRFNIEGALKYRLS